MSLLDSPSDSLRCLLLVEGTAKQAFVEKNYAKIFSLARRNESSGLFIVHILA